MVRGIKYRLPVVDSFLNWTHGSYRYVEEIFIPELKIAFNEAGYVFRTKEQGGQVPRLRAARQQGS